MTRFAAISGSLRRASDNTMLLRAAIAIAPPEVEIVLFEDVGNLPHFNPDIEQTPPPIVEAFRTLLRGCDGIMIASPEYAHGVAGAFKNALDWVVGATELGGKPVALINTSGRAVHAYAALAETIRTMGWIIVDEASPTIPIAGEEYDVERVLATAAFAEPLRSAINALARAKNESCVTYA